MIIIVLRMVLVVVVQYKNVLCPSELHRYITRLSLLGCWFAFGNLLIKCKTGLSVCKYNLGQFPMGIIIKPNHTAELVQIIAFVQGRVCVHGVGD